jgi:hypothetical protein
MGGAVRDQYDQSPPMRTVPSKKNDPSAGGELEPLQPPDPVGGNPIALTDVHLASFQSRAVHAGIYTENHQRSCV